MGSRRFFVSLTVLLSAATCAKVSETAAQANVSPALWRLVASDDNAPGMNQIATHTQPRAAPVPQARQERRNPVGSQ
jgi:hypothetical protein